MQITSIKLMISQPMTSKTPREWDFPVDEAVPHSENIVRQCADKALGLIGKPVEEIERNLTPGEEQCAYCRAKSSCKAVAAAVAEAVKATAPTMEGFEKLVSDIEAPAPDAKAALAKHYLMLPLFKKWITAIEESVQAAALNGEMGSEVGIKVVVGDQGKRTWDDAAAVEAFMKSKKIREADMYDLKLISPTEAEKRLAESKPRIWKEIEKHIFRPPGKHTVVSIDDKRPAVEIKPAAGFEDLTGDDLI